MKKIADYKILPELCLILNYFSGDADGEDAINVKKIEKLDVNFNPSLSYIVDFRDLESNWTSEIQSTVSKLVDFMKQNKGLISERRTAFITSLPNHVVISESFKRLSTELPIHFEIFSTIKAALFFLNISLDNLQLIENELQAIKENAN